jgi:hypothetical protein
MTATRTLPPLTENEGLDLALRRLVLSGTLTNEQARAVHEAYVDEVGPPPPAAEPSGRQRSWASRLAEIGGYLGAALMAAAGAVAIGNNWEEISRTGHIALMVVLASLLVAAGLVLVGVRRRAAVRSGAEESILRRLASTLLTLGAAAAGGAVMVAMLPTTGPASESVTSSEVGRALLIAAVVAGGILVLARALAPSAFAELALFGAILAASTGICLVGDVDSFNLWATVFFVVGLGWALLATFSKVVTVPTLTASLALFTAFYAGVVGEGWVRNTLLGTLVGVGILVYLIRPSWPYVAAAMLAAVTLTVIVLGDAFGAALALLAAGLVLLLFAGAVLLVQNRRKAAVIHLHR